MPFLFILAKRTCSTQVWNTAEAGYEMLQPLGSRWLDAGSKINLESNNLCSTGYGQETEGFEEPLGLSYKYVRNKKCKEDRISDKDKSAVNRRSRKCNERFMLVHYRVIRGTSALAMERNSHGCNFKAMIKPSGQ